MEARVRFCLFCLLLLLCFLLIIIILPWLVSLYSHCWPFTPCEIFIYIDYLEIPSWNFGFLVAPRNVSLVGLFLFPLSVLSGFIWERGNKVESNGPRLHLDVTNRWRHCDYNRPDRYTSLVLCFSTRFSKFRKVILIERFQQKGGVRVCFIALLGYFGAVLR